MKTKEFLLESGVYPNRKGFYAIILSIKYAKEYFIKTGKKYVLSTELYPMVAEVLKTIPANVERNIRSCISKISNEQLAKGGINPDPTNSEFIYGLMINSLGESYDYKR